MVAVAQTTSTIGMHMAVAFGVMYGFTGSVTFGGVAALIEPLCVVVLTPLHERLWRTIKRKLRSRPTQQARIV